MFKEKHMWIIRSNEAGNAEDHGTLNVKLSKWEAASAIGLKWWWIKVKQRGGVAVSCQSGTAKSAGKVKKSGKCCAVRTPVFKWPQYWDHALLSQPQGSAVREAPLKVDVFAQIQRFTFYGCVRIPEGLFAMILASEVVELVEQVFENRERLLGFFDFRQWNNIFGQAPCSRRMMSSGLGLG